MERYEHLVKHFDQQLLNQFKAREHEVHTIGVNGDEKQNNDLPGRILKIETEGLLRNRYYFEYMDYKTEFDESKMSFYNEVSLALRDGVITDTGNTILT